MGLGFGIGDDSPLRPAPFFFGAAPEEGGEGGPTMPSSSLPPPPTQLPCTLLAWHGYPDREAGEEAAPTLPPTNLT